MMKMISDLSALSSCGLTDELINDIIECQLECWPLAAESYRRLSGTKRRRLPIGDLEGSAQWNPGRIASTGAKTDKASIASRPCFLCKENRGAEQFAISWLEDWELLVNPFPILPVHFTIASKSHRPQGPLPLEMAAMAEQAPSLAIFYNGANSGASAPDHQHAQGVLSSELPLLHVVSELHPLDKPGLYCSDDLGGDVPFTIFSAVVPPGEQGMRILAALPGLGGIDPKTGLPSYKLMNAYFWMDNGILRVVVIPRKAHRPAIYNMPEPDRMLVSPGAIDMAGIFILPREEDFNRITPEIARDIYADVAYVN